MANEQIKMSIGSEIRRLRTEAGISLKRFSMMLGMNRTSLREIELGKGNPRLDTLVKIADGLGVDLADLIPK